MGLNGKNSRNKLITSEKGSGGSEDGKSKRRPFKVGPYRASSAVESWNDNGSNKATITKSSNRLTRSRSVESTGGRMSSNKRDGKSSVGGVQQELVASRKIWTTLSQKKESNSSQKISAGTLPLAGHPPMTKKRPPFSFSRNVGTQDSISNSIGGAGDEEDFDYGPNYEKIPSSQNSEVGRSPRVTFAEPVQFHINEGSHKKSKTKDNLLKMHSMPEKDWPPEQRARGRSASLDIPQGLDVEKPMELRKGGNQPHTSHSKPATSEHKLRMEMSQTDHLLKNVGDFVTDFAASRTKNVPVSLNFSYSPTPSRNKPREEVETQRKPDVTANISMESVEGLNTIQCPSFLLNSARSTMFCPNQSFSAKEEIISGGSASRPTSAMSSFFRSVSSDDIHGRIALTLEMIEQEEQKRKTLKSSSFPDKLEKLEIPGSTSGNNAWSNLPFEYPTSLASTSVSEHGTRPSSQSSVHKATNTLSQPQFVNNFVQEQQRIPEGMPHQINSPSHSSHSQTHFVKNSNNLFSDGNRNESVMSKSSTDNFVVPQVPQRYIEPPVIVHNLETSRSQSPFETCTEKTKKLFSLLDESEKADRDIMLGLSSQFNSGGTKILDPGSHCTTNKSRTSNQSQVGESTGNNLSFLQKIDSLIRKGSVELAKEHIILERKFEESLERISVLEETLIHQRELNMRNLRNSERDLKKRLCLQKEEFDLAFVRNEALINEMVAEKRALQERCDKVMKTFDEAEEKYKDQIKGLQQKHLDEIKRLRKSQITAETVKKQQWMGSKTNEIREMTVKGLEPEVQRIIQRHQQEMTEMRAWHTDELRETEERCQRKLHIQIQDIREKVSAEADDIISREKEQLTSRFEATLKQREAEFEQIRRRLTNELQEERDRASREEAKAKESLHENVRKAQIKGEIELENLKQEHDTKLANIERKHINEINSVKDINQAETKTLVIKLTKQFEAKLKEKENDVTSDMKALMENELRDREKKLKDEFEKTRKEEDASTDNRFKRMQEKFTSDLQEMDQVEKDLKLKLNQAKSQLMFFEEQVFSLKASLNMKENSIIELQEANMKMLEERAHLSSVIRREFSSQIDNLDSEVKGMRNNLVEIQAKHKLELEQKSLEYERLIHEKDAEVGTIGARVQQTIARKDETILGLQKQLEKLNFQVSHLEQLLEEQRKNLVDSMTKSTTTGAKRK